MLRGIFISFIDRLQGDSPHERRLVVSGTVQGVCFRAFTQHAAKQLNLTGWIKNLENGNVEILACGNDASLAIFKQQVTQGPTYATVDTVQCEPFPWEDHVGFKII